MVKSNLGINKFVLGAAFYLLCMFSGYLAAVVVGGYILLKETDEDLRTAAVTGFFVLLAFSLLNIVLGFFPDMIVKVQEALVSAKIFIDLSSIVDIFQGIQDFFNFLGDAALVVLAVLMLIKKPLNLKFLKNIAV